MFLWSLPKPRMQENFFLIFAVYGRDRERDRHKKKTNGDRGLQQRDVDNPPQQAGGRDSNRDRQ